MNTLIIAFIAMALSALAIADEPSSAEEVNRQGGTFGVYLLAPGKGVPFQYSELDRCDLGQPDRFSQPP